MWLILTNIEFNTGKETVYVKKLFSMSAFFQTTLKNCAKYALKLCYLFSVFMNIN